MRRLAFASAAGLFVASTVACSAVLGVDDFKIRASAPDAGDDADTMTDGAVEETGTAAECARNADCAARGEFFICRKTDARCVSIVSDDCTKVVGNYKDDNAIIFGSLLPTTGPDISTGIPVENSIELALKDFEAVGNLPPAPGSTMRRPLALVGCTDRSDEPAGSAARAATHLAKNVGVPAIIGAAFSGITIDVATTVTIPAGTLLISPSATSVAITDLADNNLVWRTSPSDVIQAAAAIKFFPILENVIRAGDTTKKLKVAIANKGDAYGSGLAQAVTAGLEFNGAKAVQQGDAFFSVLDYGDTTTKYPETVGKLVTFEPDVIFVLGTTETITEIMKGVEAEWPTTGTPPPRPRYLVADGSLVKEMTELANTAPPANGLRRRILGTIPGTTNQLFNQFAIHYRSNFGDQTSPSTGGASNAYDAMYNLAYSVVAAGSKPLTGATLAEGFARLVDKSAGPLSVGSATINSAFSKLSAGGNFDFNGASGPLDYDLAKGEAASDIQIWCLPKAAGAGDKAGDGAATKVFYNAQTGLVETTTAAEPYDQITTDCSFGP